MAILVFFQDCHLFLENNNDSKTEEMVGTPLQDIQIHA